MFRYEIEKDVFGQKCERFLLQRKIIIFGQITRLSLTCMSSGETRRIGRSAATMALIVDQILRQSLRSSPPPPLLVRVKQFAYDALLASQRSKGEK